jgi:hypothetical protein
MQNMFYRFFIFFLLGNAVLLVLSTIYHHVYEDFKEQCMAMGIRKPVYPLCIAIGAETVILIYVIGMYIRK